MPDLPLDPSAAALLGPAPTRPVHVGGLLAGVDVAGELPARLHLDGVDPEVEPTALPAAASLEAERLGDNRVRPEHLLLGWLRMAGAELDRAREELQLLRADRAHAEYERLRPAPRPMSHEGATKRPCAVLVAGVPGTGKSTPAEALARRRTAPVFSMDWQLGALVPSGAVRSDNATALAETNLTASVARQPQLGLDVVVDVTGHRREARRRWRSLTEKLGGVFVGVECVCSDERVQRDRVDGRTRGYPAGPGRCRGSTCWG